ncbi:DNA polymerase I [Salsipaludibacter albus]|uniref:DNA polymerase I n=1 Tax=Salsipaludibacter albus TaxID=2849650 RepID=UPI001EE3CD0E
MAEERPTLLLLDGHSLAYRAFYALPDTLRTQTGMLTNAVYGFTSMLIKMLGDREPDGVAVAFDKGRDIARTEAYPEYKANRSAPPDEFRPQVDLIKQVCDVLQLPVLTVAGIEADDVLATIAERAVDDGWHVYIVTGDRDAMQLPREHLTVLYTLRGITEMAEMTPDAVEDRYGIRPEQYVYAAALRGDNSDNLPGVPGVGDKTAAKLVNQFGDVDGVYANIDEVGGKKVPAMLVEHQDQVRTNVAVMRLRRDVDVEVDLDQLRLSPWDADAIRKLFATLEFRALYDRFADEVLEADIADTQASGFQRVPRRLDGGELRGWLGGIDATDAPVGVVADVSDRVPHLRLDAIGLSHADVDPVSLRLDEATDDDRTALAELLAGSHAVVAHDAKVLDHVARGLGVELEAVVIDTELAAYLLAPAQRSFSLDALALQYLQRRLEVAEGRGSDDQLSLDVGDDEWEARALRAEAVRQLAEVLATALDERDQRKLLDEVELPLVGVLAGMERAGMAVDRHVLAEMSTTMTERARDLELTIHDHAGHEFNVGSGKQLQEVLFTELELPKTRRIKTGWSTDATQLGNIIDSHPIVPAILEWREVTKLLTTYVDALPPLVDDESGRIHTTLSQTVAATGRLSSSNPNLQNIPVRRAEGREIRRAFTVGGDFDQLLVADYSQIELRVMAHLCQDVGLLDAFRSGEDIHATTAAKVFDLPLEHVDAGLRDRAKAVNYGLAYGLTPYGLGQQLGIPPDEATEIVDAYFDRFPLVGEFLQAAVVDATRDGYTTTLFGRRRYLPDLVSANRNRQQMAQRMALNAPIQGTAADIIKLAMIAVDEQLAAAGMRSRMLLQVHDEIILECPDDEVASATRLVTDAMASVADLAVPLEVDTATGTTWFDAQKH